MGPHSISQAARWEKTQEEVANIISLLKIDPGLLFVFIQQWNLLRS